MAFFNGPELFLVSNGDGGVKIGLIWTVKRSALRRVRPDEEDSACVFHICGTV